MICINALLLNGPYSTASVVEYQNCSFAKSYEDFFAMYDGCFFE